MDMEIRPRYYPFEMRCLARYLMIFHILSGILGK